MSRRNRQSKRRPSDTRRAPEIAVDVQERRDDYVVTADLPGIRKQDIDVRVKNDRVQIVVDSDGDEEQAGSFARRARERGPLTRTIELPGKVKEKRTDADYSKGRLRIVLPKRRERHSIDVK